MRSSRAFLIRASLIGFTFLLMGWCLPAYAQRVNQLDGSIDVGGGVNDYPTNIGQGESSNWESFYNISPAATLSSKTARSVLSLSYAFGWNYYGSELARHSTSHTASLGVSRKLSQRWSVRVSDNYTRTNDIQTFYALRGVAIEEEGLVVYFYPVTTATAIGTNYLNVAFDHSFSAKSTLSFGATHTFGNYGASQSPLLGLSDLQTISVNATYTRRLNERTSWNLAYNGSHFTFDKFNSAVSTSATVGLTYTLAKETSVNVSAGPSRVDNLNIPGSNTTLAVTASIAKTIKRNSFHASLSNNNATTSGVGTVSNTRSAAAGVSRALNRRVNVFADFSLFDGAGVAGNPFRTRGTSATANMGYSLARNLSLQGGLQYQRFTQPSPYAYTQRRLFVSLRYSHPNLWRSH